MAKSGISRWAHSALLMGCLLATMSVQAQQLREPSARRFHPAPSDDGPTLASHTSIFLPGPASLFFNPWLDESTILVQLEEAGVGVDLNADGDLDDTLPHLRNLDVGGHQTLPYGQFARPFPGIAPRFFQIIAVESIEGVDLDGDGQLYSVVPGVFDSRTGSATNLEIPALSSFPSSGSSLVMEAYEQDTLQDLNGDGDLDDGFLFAHSLATKHTHLVGDASLDPFGAAGDDLLFQEFQPGVPPLIQQAVVAWSARDGSLTPIPLSAGAFAAATFSQASAPRFLAVFEDEFWIGDLNGDADQDDLVLQVYDSRTRDVRNTSVGFAWPVEIGDGDVLMPVLESRLGFDATGDGVLDDFVLTGIDLETLALSPTDLAFDGAVGGFGGFGIYGPSPAFTTDTAGRWTYVVSRVDPSPNGYRIQVLDRETGTSVDLGVQVVEPGPAFTQPNADYPSQPDWIGEHYAAYLVSETSVDLNGDGDIDAADHVLHVREHATGAVQNLGLACRNDETWILDGLLVSAIDEVQQGGVDLTGDGDATDGVPMAYDLANGLLRVTGLEGRTVTPRSGGQLMTFLVVVGGQLAVHDVRDGTTSQFPHVLYQQWVSGRRLAQPVKESTSALGDINGDGDLLDSFIEILTF